MKRALVIGASGQDGAYLCRHLLGQGYEVHGGVRATSSGSLWRLGVLGVADRVRVHRLDILDDFGLHHLARDIEFQEVYNLAAQGHVGDSWEIPEYTMNVNAVGALSVFNAFPGARIFQASTADMFGDAACPALGFDESAAIRPITPYGVSKAAAHFSAQALRRRGGWIACGICFNHESPLRQDTFVTQRIAQGVARWRKTGEPFELQSVTGVRDWGWAPEFVEGFHAALQAEKPDDYVFATGVVASVWDFLVEAVGEPLVQGGGKISLAKMGSAGEPLVRLTGAPEGSRVLWCTGNPARAGMALKWWPRHNFRHVAREMVEAANHA